VTYFWTETGSVYELDADRKRLRRVTGAHAPTGNQGADMQWQTYIRMTPPVPVVGRMLLIVWGTDYHGAGDFTVRRTMTSAVEWIGKELPPRS
jgi:hypothetical protein